MPELREVAEPIQNTLDTRISLGRGKVWLSPIYFYIENREIWNQARQQ